MSLQFVFGNSGAGKSRCLYQEILRASLADPDGHFLVLVPEQFTMETQKMLAFEHPGGGLLNIDVLSFQRLAHRIFGEVGGDTREVLGETGKSLVLQKVVQERQKELCYLGSRMKKPGYIDEMKSLLSEFMQYEVGPEEVSARKHAAKEQKSLLYYKLSDVEVLYRGFREYLSERYVAPEEVLGLLADVIGESKRLSGATVVLDGFTGFTPVQNRVVGRLLSICRKVYLTVTLGDGEDPYRPEGSHRLFSMSKKTIHTVRELAAEAGCPIEEEIRLRPEGTWRFANAPALDFLEKNLFRYRKESYEKEQEEIRIFAAPTPLREIEETAVRIARLIRTEGYRYGEIAVITGDLETYANYAKQVFSSAEIPYFIDEKHSVLMNPFVEYLRASVEVCIKSCSYESMFRYLRCGMSGLTREEVDRVENYVLALGIRGKKRWQETWTRLYPGMEPEDILELNRLRARIFDGLSPLLDGFSKRKRTVTSMTRALYDFIVRGGIQQKLAVMEQEFHRANHAAMEKEYAQIYGIVMELFDKMTAILGDEPMTLAEYQQLLEVGLSQTKVALIPPSTDQVLVGDMERSRLKDIKALFFVGINDGNIPKKASGGGILSEGEKRLLKEQGMELAPDAREQMGVQRFYLYLNLTKPSRLLTLSYSHANAKGEPQGPAYLIGTIQKLFPLLAVEERKPGELSLEALEHPGTGLRFFLHGLQRKKEQPDSDALWWELYRWYLREERYAPAVRALAEAAFYENPSDRLTQATAKALYGEISPSGATRLERFAACAFAHFLQYGLQLHERAEYEFQPIDMGNLMHRALEVFSQKLSTERSSWTELRAEERDALGRSALAEAAADYGNTILESSARNRYMYRRVERILLRTLWALQEQLKRGSFTPEGFEVSFGGGRIDRVDRFETEEKVYVKVIDYKTGNTSFELLELYHGLQLQLVVYLKGALAAEQQKHPDKEAVPAGIFYYNTKDPLLTVQKKEDLDALAKRLPGELKLDGLVLAEEAVARMIDETFETIPVKLKKDGTFDAYSSVATAQQFATLHTFADRKIHALKERILNGEADAAPYLLDKKEACTYCAFAGVCGFDEKLGYTHRSLPKLSKQEIWKEMEGETK